jgi:hypothetical protein
MAKAKGVKPSSSKEYPSFDYFVLSSLTKTIGHFY